jgi:dethiobiotin synthetase
MGRGIFIIGTDTGVGKTLVGGGLAALLREKGVNVGVMKPVESGCRRISGRLLAADALFLREMSGCRDDISLVNPYAFEHPLSPAQAAELENVEVRLDVIREAYRTLAGHHDIILVEGAGGLMTPLNSKYFMADLPLELGGMPVLVVSRNSLGTINHTLLTVGQAESGGLDVIGVVLNRTLRKVELASEHNEDALRRRMRVPFLGAIPYLPRRGKEAIVKAVRDNMNIEPLVWYAGS